MESQGLGLGLRLQSRCYRLQGSDVGKCCVTAGLLEADAWRREGCGRLSLTQEMVGFRESHSNS